MKTRAPEPEGTSPLSSETRVPVSTDIRLKLEGGIEVLEAAHGRYAVLEKLLREQEWQPRVRARLALLRESIHQEAALVDALARVRQRARVERWPETAPALVLAREVEQLRRWLGMLIHRRLGLPLRQKLGPVVENLRLIERIIGQTALPPLAPDEEVLLRGGFSPDLMLPGLLTLGLLSLLILFLVAEPGFESLVSCSWICSLWLLFSACWLLAQRERSGRFWLTETRLIWEPRSGLPTHVPMHAIVHLRLVSSHRVKVDVADGHTLHLDFIHDALRLAARVRKARSSVPK